MRFILHAAQDTDSGETWFIRGFGVVVTILSNKTTTKEIHKILYWCMEIYLFESLTPFGIFIELLKV